MSDLVSALITAGGFGVLITGVIALVRIAVGASERRADDWRTAAQTAAAANVLNSASIDKLIGSVEQLSASVQQLAATQRDMMALLQTVAADRRTVT